MTLTRFRFPAYGLSFALLLAAAPSAAFPGVYLSKKDSDLAVHSAHVILMQKENVSVVTVMPDFSGEQEPFAIVMPVPADVTWDRFRSVKTEYINRVDEMTAPRFLRFFEMDPCDTAPPQQEWERDLRVKTTGFMGGDSAQAEKTVPKELIMDLNTEFKRSAESEYRFMLIGADAPDPDADEGKEKSKAAKKKEKDKKAKKGQDASDAGVEEEEPPPSPVDFATFVNGSGYKVPEPVRSALDAYVQQGMKLAVIEVDTRKTELVAGGRAQLGGIRYWSTTPVTKIPSTLGLFNSAGKQDLFVYVLAPQKRWGPTNYKAIFPPTNIGTLFDVQKKEKKVYTEERMPELYNAIYDRILEKTPGVALFEYAWHTKGCGQPCPNEPLLVNELMTLGGDVLEAELVSEKDAHPEPPPETDEEKKAFAEDLKLLKTAKEKREAIKARKEERYELARRKGLIARQNYVMSRFHLRYTKDSLKKDLEIGEVPGQVTGGIALPTGTKPDVNTKVEPVQGQGASQFQVRVNSYQPWDGEVKCEKPERGRWGKTPRHVRWRRKVFTGTNLNLQLERRSMITPEDVLLEPLPALGFQAAKVGAKADTPPDAGAEEAVAEKEKGCGCVLTDSASSAPRNSAVGALLAAIALLARRRR